jgi:hypothetical protein
MGGRRNALVTNFRMHVASRATKEGTNRRGAATDVTPRPVALRRSLPFVTVDRADGSETSRVRRPGAGSANNYPDCASRVSGRVAVSRECRVDPAHALAHNSI